MASSQTDTDLVGLARSVYEGRFSDALPLVDFLKDTNDVRLYGVRCAIARTLEYRRKGNFDYAKSHIKEEMARIFWMEIDREGAGEALRSLEAK